jgi:hypothetical protein
MNRAIEVAAVSDTEVLSREKEDREKHIDGWDSKEQVKMDGSGAPIPLH